MRPHYSPRARTEEQAPSAPQKREPRCLCWAVGPWDWAHVSLPPRHADLCELHLHAVENPHPAHPHLRHVLVLPALSGTWLACLGQGESSPT